MFLLADNLSSGLYDSHGVHYRVPEYCLTYPANLIDTSDVADSDLKDDLIRPEEVQASLTELEANCTVKEKFVIRFSTNQKDLILQFYKSAPVYSLREKIAQELSCNSSSIRLFLLGRLLHDRHTLESEGWREGLVIQAWVSGVEEL